jgi:membrane associated rhomboid family serine protease
VFFPLKDNIPTKTFPFINWLIIAINIAVYVHQLNLGYRLEWFFFEHGLVPKRVTNYEYFLQESVFPFFSHMFIHGGFFHLLGNMYMLFIFGDNIEDRIGHGKYLLMYVCFGLFAAGTQYLISPDSLIPMIGASGAVAGVMGAYMVFYPHARVKSLLIIIIFITVVNVPAILYLFLWFLLQFMMGTASLSLGQEGGGVAFWAHIGGFVFGFLYALRVKTR